MVSYAGLGGMPQPVPVAPQPLMAQALSPAAPVSLLSAPTTPRRAGSKPAPRDILRQQCYGKVRSWQSDKNWGFIVSDRFEGDLFVHAQDLAADLSPEQMREGLPVGFIINQDPKGRVRAEQVCSSLSPASDMVGTTVDGWVRFFHADKKWGFVQSAHFSGDLFMHREEIPEWVGDSVLVPNAKLQFTIEVGAKSGKPHAAKVVPLDENMQEIAQPFDGSMLGTMLTGGPVGGGDMAGSLSGGAPTSTGERRVTVDVTSNPHLLGLRADGVIRRILADKQFGFINSDAFEGDLFFHFSDVEGSMQKAVQEGMRVQFVIGNRDGKGRAVEVVLDQQSAGAFAGVGTLATTSLVGGGTSAESMTGAQLQGTVKNYNAVKQYGFVVCPSFDGDLFMHAAHNNFGHWTPQPGEPVNFTVGQDNQGRPAAHNVTPAHAQMNQGPIPPAPPLGGGPRLHMHQPPAPNSLINLIAQMNPHDAAAQVYQASTQMAEFAAALQHAFSQADPYGAMNTDDYQAKRPRWQ
mmetsp:Transcript_83069/g.221965  ORF Transcript_83069/g.221965 Transcript_83069/m.221965 type:complete len:519 (+) Transcript_83069:85-1641(+)